MRWAWLLMVCAACGDNDPLEEPVFAWDGMHDVGAFGLDRTGPDDPGLFDAIDRDTAGDGVAMFYGHTQRTTRATIEALLDGAAAAGLPTLTYADLAHGPPRAGISLSFDDNDVDGWYAMRTMLRERGAHVSFFVTRYAEMTDAEHDELRELAADGNTIEAHGVHHVNAVTYIPEHGLEAYLAEEVQPSIDVLRADGYCPVAYAHPGGGRTPELDAALHSRIRFARGIRGAPK